MGQRFIITEQERNSIRMLYEEQISADKRLQINQLITTESKKVQAYYQQHYSKPETISKFNNKNNINEVKKYILTIRYKVYPMSERKSLGFVKKEVPGLINLNVDALFIIQGDNVSAKGSMLYDTILHEMAHLMTYSVGHTPEFWTNFRKLLHEGVQCGIYRAENYSKNPVKYCGMTISESPI